MGSGAVTKIFADHFLWHSIPSIMSDVMEFVRGRAPQKIAAGEVVIRQGEQTGCLFFLMEGKVEILRDEVLVATASEPGILFGEMSALLGTPHTATVRAIKPCTFCIVPNALAVLQSSPEICHSVCRLLAHRLNMVNKYLVEVKHKLEGDEHIEFVIKTLEGLLHHQPKRSQAMPPFKGGKNPLSKGPALSTSKRR